jgi:hypothetical protein
MKAGAQLYPEAENVCRRLLLLINAMYVRTAASVAPLATVVDMSRAVAKVDRGAKATDAAFWRTGV